MPESTALREPLRVPVPRARAAVSQGLLGIPSLRFHRDGRRARAVVGWRLLGPPGGPVVAALGGIVYNPGPFTCAEGPRRESWSVGCDCRFCNFEPR